mmetsp:Transcript_54756/g.159726  ORF Transcript_54756/g.159726 Transcript_54756/m.159726 type:complete len:208 (+) Transcript_54756:231-854(+)
MPARAPSMERPKAPASKPPPSPLRHESKAPCTFAFWRKPEPPEIVSRSAEAAVEEVPGLSSCSAASSCCPESQRSYLGMFFSFSLVSYSWPKVVTSQSLSLPHSASFAATASSSSWSKPMPIMNALFANVSLLPPPAVPSGTAWCPSRSRAFLPGPVKVAGVEAARSGTKEGCSKGRVEDETPPALLQVRQPSSAAKTQPTSTARAS